MSLFFVTLAPKQGDNPFKANLKKLRLCFIVIFFLFPWTARASFIESTMGTAIVNDATATYFNPAALTLLKNSQFIALDSVAYFQSEFSGSVTQQMTGYTQFGSSNVNSVFNLPSIYLGVPLTSKITGGFAVVANDFTRNPEGNSILRYVQANNQVEDVDFVPSLAWKINEIFSVGAGLNFSKAYFTTKPIIGIPGFNIPDSQSVNKTNGTAFGGDLGILLKPTKSTLIGLNYRSKMTYRESGTSTLNSTPELISPNYHFNYWTPARSVLSIGHYVTRDLGLLATVQYIQWNIFKTVNVYNFATQTIAQPTIVPFGQIPYHFHNSWLYTVGGQYQINPAWIVRVASSYVEAPSHGYYQIDNGDNIIVGASMGYNLTKAIVIDGSYAHSFVINQDIRISNSRIMINGVNKGSGDSVSLKLTLNF